MQFLQVVEKNDPPITTAKPDFTRSTDNPQSATPDQPEIFGDQNDPQPKGWSLTRKSKIL